MVTDVWSRKAWWRLTPSVARPVTHNHTLHHRKALSVPQTACPAFQGGRRAYRPAARPHEVPPMSLERSARDDISAESSHGRHWEIIFQQMGGFKLSWKLEDVLTAPDLDLQEAWWRLRCCSVAAVEACWTLQCYSVMYGGIGSLAVPHCTVQQSYCTCEFSSSARVLRDGTPGRLSAEFRLITDAALPRVPPSAIINTGAAPFQRRRKDAFQVACPRRDEGKSAPRTDPPAGTGRPAFSGKEENLASGAIIRTLMRKKGCFLLPDYICAGAIADQLVECSLCNREVDCTDEDVSSSALQPSSGLKKEACD
ncbi:hypothetical protein Bbelb_204310 [Branchiostoma belcheri]|nr:hypothetical protein Bbelb_204310 [Branchiostoma belcheri]